MKKIFIMILSCNLLFCPLSVLAENSPNVRAQGAVLMDGETGRVLWGKNENTPLTMASTTKIMTAILVLEEGNLDDIVKVSSNAANTAKVRMNLSPNEEIRLGDLLYAMMLKSYNDAAVAIAEHMSGSVESFCQHMTERAKEIGTIDTVFGSPNGLDNTLPFEKHHSTARDMAFLASYALKNPKFVELINTQHVEIPMKGGKGKHYSVDNANRFLNMYNGACGVKTGYTNKAGQCFVGAAKRGDTTLVTAVLGSGWGSEGKEQKWKDTKALMDFGFENFQKETVISKGTSTGYTEVKHSQVPFVAGYVKEDCSLLLSQEQLGRIQIEVQQKEALEAPVETGQSLGQVKIWLDGEQVGELEIVSAQSAPKSTFMQRMKELGKQWGNFELSDVLNALEP